MTTLPEPPAASAAGQAANPLTDSVIQAAVRDVIHQSSYRDDSPVPAVGSAPPVPQPGRPPMSSKATDDSVRMIAFGGMTLLVCGGASLVMVASEFADPEVIGMICAAPVAVALPILALARLAGKAKAALPEEHHHHYSGPVYQDQRNVHTSTRGVWAKTNNQQ